MKKALIVSPYLDHLGGGERYMLAAASVMETLGYTVYFSWDNLTEIIELATMLGISLQSPQLDPEIKRLYGSQNPLRMYQATRGYACVLYLSDGSLPLLGGKKNLLHMQVPFHGVGGRSWKNRIKKRSITAFVVNSRFTKKVIDREYAVTSTVLYPPVTPIVGTQKKEKIILSVGRFEPSLNTKHQDVLITAFRELTRELPGWKLVLAGGSSSEAWMSKLKKQAAGVPIEFAENIAHADLSALYQKATLYWHAAGYGIDETKNPELTEHFGISTVEAVSAGCMPLVVPYGGQREIVTDPAYHWQTIAELQNKTRHLIKNHEEPSIDIRPYTVEAFREKLQEILL